MCPEMSALTKMAKISKNRQIRKAADFTLTNWTKIRQNRQFCQVDFTLTNWTKIRQNRQFCQVDFTLTNWTKTRQNRQIHEHSLGLTEFRRNLPFFLLRTFLDLSGFARLVNKDTRYQV